MNNSFYHIFMRSASVILFVVSIIVFVGGLGGAFAMATIVIPSAGSMSTMTVLAAFVGVLQAAALPLFGAALLYRIDLWLEASE
jgi:ABC-type maltose transport system permease subunit